MQGMEFGLKPPLCPVVGPGVQVGPVICWHNIYSHLPLREKPVPSGLHSTSQVCFDSLEKNLNWVLLGSHKPKAHGLLMLPIKDPGSGTTAVNGRFRDQA